MKKKAWLEKFDSFYISGKDTKKFLNGITTTNIINNNDEIFKTCWLTPKAILRSIFEIHIRENIIIIIIIQGSINEIRKYFEDIIFPSDDVNVSKPCAYFRVQEIDELNSWRKYTPFIFNDDRQEEFCIKNNLEIMNKSDLQEWKINQAIPILDNEIDGKNNPLELGLSDLIDFNKGCFLGQETIAKIKNLSILKHEIRLWTANKFNKELELNNKKIYLTKDKIKSVGYITRFYKSKLSKLKGLAMIKRNYLRNYNCFFSEDFGEINIKKSIGSIFL